MSLRFVPILLPALPLVETVFDGRRLALFARLVDLDLADTLMIALAHARPGHLQKERLVHGSAPENAA
jgi:hypothetical protein